MAPPTLPNLFLNKKVQILQSLAIPDDTYTDKSPKGSIDAPIVDLIREINDIDGLVTTSSCSGRVSVFVEGPRPQLPISIVDAGVEGEDHDGGDDDDEGSLKETGKKVRGGPGGKGGGKWLFVSHEALDLPSSSSCTATPTSNDEQGQRNEEYFTKLCGLQRLPPSLQAKTPTTYSDGKDTASPPALPRLIHLSFSPLILHILTATLSSHARPLLSAAINAGFRESGVQSLSALSHTDHHNKSQHQTSNNSNGNSNNPAGPGTMVAIRTAGLTFDTVIGRVTTSPDGTERMEALVDEDYLAMCFGVVNERFEWNESRKERLRDEIRGAFERVEEKLGSESKEERRVRKREEGLRRQRETGGDKKEGRMNEQVEDVLDDTLEMEVR